jgi:hypothetical protein
MMVVVKVIRYGLKSHAQFLRIRAVSQKYMADIAPSLGGVFQGSKCSVVIITFRRLWVWPFGASYSPITSEDAPTDSASVFHPG